MVSFADHYNVISIDRLPQKLKLENFHGNLKILLYVSPSSPQLQKFLFFIKKYKELPLFSKWLVGIYQISFYREC